MVAPLLYGLYVIGSGTAARVAVRKLAQTGAKVAGNLISRHRTKKAAEKASELFMKASPLNQAAVTETVFELAKPAASRFGSQIKKAVSTTTSAGKKKAGFKKRHSPYANGGKVTRRRKK
jgi:hypothetical protein